MKVYKMFHPGGNSKLIDEVVSRINITTNFATVSL